MQHLISFKATQCGILGRTVHLPLTKRPGLACYGTISLWLPEKRLSDLLLSKFSFSSYRLL